MTVVWLEVAGVVLAGALIHLLLLSHQWARRERLRDMRRAVGAAPSARSTSRAFDMVAGLGDAIVHRRLLSEHTVNQLRQGLRGAGLRTEAAIGAFVGIKVLLSTGLPLAAFMLAWRLSASIPATLLAMLASALFGLLLPDIIIGSMRRAYVARVDRGLADALSLMVICAEAGLPVSSSIGRVAYELRHAHPATADELAMTANALVFDADSQQALLDLGRRTGLTKLKRIGSAAIHSMQHDAPLAQALGSLALDLRIEALARCKHRAAPVMLTMPMILFVVPTLFVLVGGPAVLMALKVLSK